MSAEHEMSQATEMQQSSAASRKRHSWLGGTIKSLLSQTASNARTAIDTVRERFDNTSKHESTTIPTQEYKHDAESTKRPIHRHRRTISARTAISSWRSHLPRRSIDHKRRSLADLLDHSECQEEQISGPECFYDAASQKRSWAKDSKPRDVHTSIDIQEDAPSLRLDLGLSDLDFDDQPFCVETVVVHQPKEMTIGKPSSPSILLNVFEDKHSPTASELFMPDPLQPVAEVRISTPPANKMDVVVLQDVADTITFESPLPGTTLQMDFEKTYPDIGESIERDIAASPTPGQRNAWYENATADSNCASSARHPDITMSDPTLIIGTTSELGKGAVGLGSSDDIRHAHDNGAPTTSQHDLSTSIPTPFHSGPPSPERSVILPIRAKPLVSTHDKRTDASSKRYMHNSDQADLTVALLRERTSDDYASVLDKLGTKFDAVSFRSIDRSKIEEVPAQTMLTNVSTPSRDSVSPLPQTKHNTTPQRDDHVSTINDSSPIPTPQWLLRKIQESSSLATNSSSPAGSGRAEEPTHNHFSLLSVQDDSDDEDGADLPDCFNIGVTYG